MLTRFRTSVAGKDQGFTLIELLVVIIIIGILSAIAVPVFLNQRKKAVDASLKSDLRAANIAVETWIVDHPGAAMDDDYTGANLPSADQPNPGALAEVKYSPGNMLALTIEEVPIGSPVSGDYCLFSWNENASKSTGAGTAQYWRSDGGGMQAGVAFAAECHNQA